MKIAVIGNETSVNELTGITNTLEWVVVKNLTEAIQLNDIDTIFNLSENAAMEDYSLIAIPVFVNSVTTTLQQMKTNDWVVRINGWHGFIKRSSWEFAGTLSSVHQFVADSLQRKLIACPDEPGFISARIISMIINEAFFAKEDKISTEDEIDIAMKLGTNYPKGPFEWAREVGIKNIYELLFCLSKTDNRYQPASLLQTTIQQP